MVSDFAQFNACDRYTLKIESLRGDAPRVEWLRRYAEAARADLGRMVGYALPFFFPLKKEIPFDVNLTIDDSDLRFMARIVPSKTGYRISLSLGLVLAIDDASCLLARWALPKAEVAFELTQQADYIEPRFLDYGFLLSPHLKGASTGLASCCLVGFADLEGCEYYGILANLSVLWVVLHEIGHIQLGHLKGLSGADTLGATDTFEAQASEPHEIDVRMATEFAADIYASFQFFATFFRADAIGMVLPRALASFQSALLFLVSACAAPAMIMHRAQRSFARGPESNTTLYPPANVRLLNTLAAMTPAIDNNRRVVSPIFQAFGQKDQTIELTMQDFMPIVVSSIAYLDRFLRYVQSVDTFLPWKLQVEIILLPEGQRHHRVEYSSNNAEVMDTAMSEVAAAVITACSGVAEFSESTRFARTYDAWIRAVETGYRIWSPIAKRYEEGFRALVRDQDIHIGLTYAFFVEVARSRQLSNEYELKMFHEMREAVRTTLKNVEKSSNED